MIHQNSKKSNLNTQVLLVLQPLDQLLIHLPRAYLMNNTFFKVTQYAYCQTLAEPYTLIK